MMFSTQKIASPFVNIFGIISLFAAELEEPKIGVWGEGLTNMGLVQFLSKYSVRFLFSYISFLSP